MTAVPASASAAPMSLLRGFGGLFLIVFSGFLAIGVPMPALSLEVHDALGFGAVTVGWIIGSQSFATILTRHRAGTLSDRRGPKSAVLLGLPMATASGGLYLLASQLEARPSLALLILLIGRLLLGFGESLFVTGAMSWGMARLGPARAGRVMAWQGIAIYAAMGLGAPMGLALQRGVGFSGVALFTMASPLAAMLIAWRLPAVPPSGGGRASFLTMVGLIWRPGLVLALATAPFAAMATFLPLAYAAQGWTGAGWAILGFAVGYTAVRVFLGHLPDRRGGIAVTVGSLAVEAVGQIVLWLAADPTAAIAGAALTGIGFSLVFPAMGVEAVRRVRPEQRGRAVGNFIAFFDLAIGVTGPLIGFFVQPFGFPVAFLIGLAAALAALALLPALARMRPA